MVVSVCHLKKNYLRINFSLFIWRYFLLSDETDIFLCFGGQRIEKEWQLVKCKS